MLYNADLISLTLFAVTNSLIMSFLVLCSSPVTPPGIFLQCLLVHTLFCHHAQQFLPTKHPSVLLSCLSVCCCENWEVNWPSSPILCSLTCLWECLQGLLVSHVTANQTAGWLSVCVCACVWAVKPLISDVLHSFVESKVYTFLLSLLYTLNSRLILFCSVHINSRSRDIWCQWEHTDSPCGSFWLRLQRNKTYFSFFTLLPFMAAQTKWNLISFPLVI